MGSSVEFRCRVSGGNFGTSVELWWTGGSGNFRLMVGSGNWCGASVEFGMGRSRVELGVRTGVETRCLRWVIEVGCAVERRGRFVRGVCGN